MSASRAIGLDLGGTKIHAGVVGRDGTVEITMWHGQDDTAGRQMCNAALVAIQAWPYRFCTQHEPVPGSGHDPG